MVELKLEPIDNELSRDFYVSVRVGDVQKLSRVAGSRAYKFSSATVGDRKFGKIEVFKKVGNAPVGIIPDDKDQQVTVSLEDGTQVKFGVALTADAAEKPAPVPVKAEDAKAKRDANPKVKAAKDYLVEHNLEMRLSEAMQAVLRERPEDPAKFVSDRLAKSAGMVQKLPKAETPKAEAPAVAEAPKEEAAAAPAPEAPKEEAAAAQVSKMTLEEVTSALSKASLEEVKSCLSALRADQLQRLYDQLPKAPKEEAAVETPKVEVTVEAPKEKAAAAPAAEAPKEDAGAPKSGALIVEGLANAARASSKQNPVAAAGLAVTAASVAAAMPTEGDPSIVTEKADAAMNAALEGSATAEALTEEAVAASLAKAKGGTTEAPAS